MTVWVAVIGAVSGLIGGAVGSLVAPWVVARIERVKITAEQQRQRVDEWRRGFASAETADRIEDYTFLGDEWYLSLRPHLTPETLATLEAPPPRTVYVQSDAYRRGRLAAVLVAEVDRVARQWDVV